jgi:glutamine amidotransferase
MRVLTVAIIDFGLGNHASLRSVLRSLGFHVIVSNDVALLNSADLFILPGVGAFPFAMRNIVNLGLGDYIRQKSLGNFPIIGICLGMQLLTEGSFEGAYTDGLNLIPGKIVPFDITNTKAHIGWNSVEGIGRDGSNWLDRNKSHTFYFNHSFYYEGLNTYHVAVSHHNFEFAVIIRKGNVVGLQFHPEKSQEDGKEILRKIILGLTHD